MFAIKTIKNIKQINKAKGKYSFINSLNNNFFPFANCNKKFFTTKRAARDESKHIDEKDDEFFKTIKDWWNPEGSMRTLHHFNDLRIEYILNSLKNTMKVTQNSLNKKLPLEDYTALDVGCGGGILTESLGRLGAKVVGIDSNENSYEVALNHLNSYEGRELELMQSKISYFNGSVDNFINKLILENTEDITQELSPEVKAEKLEKHDIITAMEVIEHVNEPLVFLQELNSLLKKNGVLFLSTINRNNYSYLMTITLAENLLGIIPKGTHDWNKYITLEEMQNYLNDAGFTMVNCQGCFYNPLTSNMSLVSNTDVNYILMAIKN